jgi:putative inorganic carbon (HCO3(-)) transporter
MSSYSHTKKISPVRQWFRHNFYEKKLNSAPGIIVLCLFAAIVGYASAFIDYRAGLGITGAFAGILMIILFKRYPYFGLYFIIAYSALPALLSRIFTGNNALITIIGYLPDLSIILVFISVITKNQFFDNKEISFWGNPITMSFVILFLFYILEALNPNMHSFLGWVSFIRTYIISLFSFYIVFCLLRTWVTTKFFIYFSLILTTLLAIYSCKQQWFGITNFELRWATASPVGYRMLMQGGLLRKWSTLSDPATAGILFSSVSLQCMILLLRQPGIKNKIWLSVALIFNLLGYAYSGTRTATLMLVAGIAFYGISTIYEKRTLIFLVVSIGAFVTLMVMPFAPPAIGRIRSTFEGTKDPSAAVRDYDRHQVQPYLYEHPMGGGIYTSGQEGPKYNPGHFLQDFQPDSGYMKIFAEEGWIGLAVTLIMYFVILSYGLLNFYKAANPELQDHSIALITMIFSLMVGQYSQVAMGSAPGVFLYFGSLVFFLKMSHFDNKQINS